MIEPTEQECEPEDETTQLPLDSVRTFSFWWNNMDTLRFYLFSSGQLDVFSPSRSSAGNISPLVTEENPERQGGRQY